MSEILVKDLLQAKALGCLDMEENETFFQLMEEDNEFPWQELGQYQNLVAHMPTLLEFETPDAEVKNKIVQELQDQHIAVQSEEEPEKEDIQDLTETIEVIEDEDLEIEDIDLKIEDGDLKIEDEDLKIEDEDLRIEDEDLRIEDEEIVAPDFQQTDKVDRKKIETKSEISFKEPEKPEFDLNAFKTGKPKLSEKQKVKPQKSTAKKESPTKTPKNYVSKFSTDEKVSRVGSNKILIISGVVIVIILIFLLVMYLGLSSEIDNNKNEIEKLKQRIGLTIIQEESFLSESRIT